MSIKNEYTKPVTAGQLKKSSTKEVIFAVVTGILTALVPYAGEIFAILAAILPSWLGLMLTPEHVQALLLTITGYFGGKAKAKREDAKAIEVD